MKSKLFLYLLGKQCGFSMSEYRKLVEESQYWNNDQIQDYQIAKLQPLIVHAFKDVPQYQKIFKSIGMIPDDIKTINDLKYLPIIHKQEVMDATEEFLAVNYKIFKASKHHTGGTTGIPFSYYTDRNAWALNWALKMRTFDWAGFHYGDDRLGVMAGGSLNPNTRMSISHRLWRFANNYYTMPITHMDGEIMKEYATQLAKQRIQFLRGYPSAINTFSEYLNERNQRIALKGIFTTAEMLLPHQRDSIKKAFGCDIFDTYGCGDGMGHATECEKHEGLHICHETSIMEIVDSNGNEVKEGKEGEIVLTSLYDYAMPLIRYAPGDRAVKLTHKCSCGRQMPLIKIIGRTSDAFTLANGTILNGLSLPYEELTEDLRRFQIIQEASDSVTLKLEPKHTLESEKIDRYYKLMQYHCGEGINIDIEIVDKIEVPSSEKFRYVISRIKK